MPHTVHYVSADAVIAHLATFVPALSPQLQAQYTGFAAVSAVTVYELAIKHVFYEFARKKHSVFGHFTQEHFDRINGRISLKSLRSEHVPKFGEKYLLRFGRLLDAEEKAVLVAQRFSVKSSYGNLVSWRHEFAHQGQPPRNATFQEVVRSYDLGKKVIACLATSLNR